MMEPCSSTVKHDPHHYMHESNGYWCEGRSDRPALARDGDSMSEPRIVSPEEAQGRLRNISPTVDADNDHLTLLHTVATEPERTRAAVVKVLRNLAGRRLDALDVVADAIEEGADL